MPDPPAVNTAAEARPIGPGWELFVDECLLSRRAGAVLRLHPPVPRDVVFAFDAPWEGPHSGYVTMLTHGGEHRLYYRGWQLPLNEYVQSTAVAVSRDGVGWERPTLGHIAWQETRANNLVWTGDRSHNFTPFVDTNPAAPEEARFKAISSVRIKAPAPWPRGLVPYVSNDGYRWHEAAAAPVITDGKFDSQNLAFWDSFEHAYVAYYRDVLATEGGAPVRAIKRATSPDFVRWTPGEWLDYGDAPIQHLYTNSVTPYARANRLYLAFPKRYVPGRGLYTAADFPDARLESGLTDGLFMTSRDGRHWDQYFREAFLRPGRDPRNWTDRSNEIAWGLVQTGPDELSLYWLEHFHHPSCRLRRGTLRLDGFASLSAGYAGGEAVTHPLLVSGGELVLNYATSAAGSVRVEVQDAAGVPISGYELAESPVLYGDAVDRCVRWQGDRAIGLLAGPPVRLRFVLQDADLFAFRIGQRSGP